MLNLSDGIPHLESLPAMISSGRRPVRARLKPGLGELEMRMIFRSTIALLLTLGAVR
jgi:hypothetical protein